MKVSVEIFYKKNVITGEVLEVQSIGDQYVEVQVAFHKDEITVEQLKEALKGWSNITQRDWVGKFVVDGILYIQCQAKDIPSIGNIICGTQSIQVEIDEDKIGV